MDILKRILELREERHWSEYQLAEKSGLTQSTISSWYRKNLVPSVPSLEKICDAFGITLSQFFMKSDENTTHLTRSQQDLIELTAKLSPEQHQALITFLKSL